MGNEQLLAAAQDYLEVKTSLEDLELRKLGLTQNLAKISEAFREHVYNNPYSQLVAEIGGEYYLIEFGDAENENPIRSFRPIDLLA